MTDALSPHDKTLNSLTQLCSTMPLPAYPGKTLGNMSGARCKPQTNATNMIHLQEDLSTHDRVTFGKTRENFKNAQAKHLARYLLSNS